ncbi:MAG: hypothetical protein SCH98_19210, partial [Deferrisomatales bacterium]|nr:hypothetical protein [Deferrisomatales bacterium]
SLGMRAIIYHELMDQYTSILERMAGPLCDALTGRSDGYETLEYLERSHLFLIPLDDERDWYRYHNLFGQFLRSRLERGFTDQIGGLHRAAAEWFSENGRPAEAVEHMLATGCSDRAAGLMAGCWREIYAAGQARTVAAWVERLPRDTLERHPTLEVAHCWTQCAQGRYDQAVTSLKVLSSGDRQQRLDPLDRDEMYTLESTIPLLEGRIEECHREVEVNLPKLSRTGSFAHGVASNALGFCLTTAGRFDEADAVLKRGLKSHSQTGSMYGTVFALCSLGWGELSQGHLTAGLAQYRTAMAHAREVIPRASIPGSVAAIFLADVLFEMDRLGEAEQLLSDHFALIPKVSILDVVVLGYLTFARIHFMQSRRKEAC